METHLDNNNNNPNPTIAAKPTNETQEEPSSAANSKPMQIPKSTRHVDTLTLNGLEYDVTGPDWKVTLQDVADLTLEEFEKKWAGICRGPARNRQGMDDVAVERVPSTALESLVKTELGWESKVEVKSKGEV